ncbi:MAG TPA: hypothetical protein VGA34_01645, partial [Alteraurantiacibacter sp.]
MRISKAVWFVAAAPLALAGCSSSGQLVVDQGVGITALRSVCPAVGIPDYTGDITLFTSPTGRTADAIDMVAAMTNVRTTCNPDGEEVFAQVDFDVYARRLNTAGARTMEIPYFVTVLRGGDSVVSKRVGTVTLSFVDGQERAEGKGTAAAYVNRAEATLPPDIRERITRKRKAGDTDAAVDPLTEPDVRAA